MRVALVAIGATIWAGSVVAHDPATLDAMPSPHNGQIRMAGPYHLELVIGLPQTQKLTPVALYVTDHLGTPSVLRKAVVQVICGTGAAPTLIRLHQKSPDHFEGAGAVSPSFQIECEAVLRTADGNSWAARFTPRQRLIESIGVRPPR
jgi:hypothetical protein